MTRTLTIIAGVLAAGYTVKHPELALLAFPIVLLLIGWALGTAILGAWRLLRYGGRAAKASHSPACQCPPCTWARAAGRERPPLPPMPPWWGPR